MFRKVFEISRKNFHVIYTLKVCSPYKPPESNCPALNVRSKPLLTVTPRRLVRPSRLTDVIDVVMMLMNMVVIIRPANIHTRPSSLPVIVLGALSPYLKKNFMLCFHPIKCILKYNNCGIIALLQTSLKYLKNEVKVKTPPLT